jgi:hypothetical protein
VHNFTFIKRLLNLIPVRPQLTASAKRILFALAIAVIGYAIVLLFPRYHRFALFGFLLQLLGLIPIMIYCILLASKKTLALIPTRRSRRG